MIIKMLPAVSEKIHHDRAGASHVAEPQLTAVRDAVPAPIGFFRAAGKKSIPIPKSSLGVISRQGGVALTRIDERNRRSSVEPTEAHPAHEIERPTVQDPGAPPAAKSAFSLGSPFFLKKLLLHPTNASLVEVGLFKVLLKRKRFHILSGEIGAPMDSDYPFAG